MSARRTFTLLVWSVGCLLLGGIVSAFLFGGVQHRTLLKATPCIDSCLDRRQLLGLIGSIVVQKTPSLLPDVVLETDKTVVIRHPRPDAPIHYVIIPKRDIKHIADIGEEDQDYLLDAFTVMRELITREKLHEYRVLTNGPGLQDVAYLHFHLRAERL